jgi:hypothetical protein
VWLAPTGAAVWLQLVDGKRIQKTYGNGALVEESDVEFPPRKDG